MAKINSEEKNIVYKKFLEFQISGLLKYGKYLETQLKIASKSESKKLYKKYIENEIIRNTKKIKSVEDKM
ncbi:MAG: hypothetical protein SFY56_08700 [Bacteroidota bacterium]|nr:hypothetical protein [Bacteroidota bacterium]